MKFVFFNLIVIDLYNFSSTFIYGFLIIIIIIIIYDFWFFFSLNQLSEVNL